MKDQRGDVARGAKIHDFADDQHVVADLMDVKERAVEPRHCLVEDRRPGDAATPANVGEPLG